MSGNVGVNLPDSTFSLAGAMAVCLMNEIWSAAKTPVPRGEPGIRCLARRGKPRTVQKPCTTGDGPPKGDPFRS